MFSWFKRPITQDIKIKHNSEHFVVQSKGDCQRTVLRGKSEPVESSDKNEGVEVILSKLENKNLKYCFHSIQFASVRYSGIIMSEIVSAVVTNWYYQVPILAGLVSLLWFSMKIWRHVREQQIRIIPAAWNGIHAHQWSLIQCLTEQATCCLCKSLIVDAMFCYSCGVCLDFNCYKSVNSFFTGKLSSLYRAKSLRALGQCKAVSISTKKATQTLQQLKQNWKHHWIQGNLPHCSKCFICGEFCDDDDGGRVHGEADIDLQSAFENSANCFAGTTLTGVADHSLIHHRCCWCQRTVHERCFERASNKHQIEGVCDFGKYAPYILPPYCVVHRRVWTSNSRRAIILEDIKELTPNDLKGLEWQPMLVIANPKSGNNDANKILTQFLTILNPIQVIDLSRTNIDFGLQLCKMIHLQPVRILVAGGDGTVGWVLNTIQAMSIDPQPLIAIVPLGTGNDLSRVLGWGDGSADRCSYEQDNLLEAIHSAQPVDLDRWCVQIVPMDIYHRSTTRLLASLHIPPSIMPTGRRSLFMYNYFSVGVDALVALNFHQTRKSKLYEFLFR